MELRMPLQTENVRLALKTDGFDQPILTAAGLDAQALAQRLDRLMMNGNNPAATALGIQLAQAAASLPGDGVDVLVVILVRMNFRLIILGGNVLVQSAAQRDIDELSAPADAKHWSASFHAFMQQFHLIGIAQAVACPVRMQRLFTVALWADVGSALQYKTIQKLCVIGRRMLLRCLMPSPLTDGIMKTITSRDMTQCATDCSRYWRDLDWSPVAPGCG